MYSIGTQYRILYEDDVTIGFVDSITFYYDYNFI